MSKLNQVITAVIPERRAIELQCPHCHTVPDRVGVKFCSNCGSPLVWDNIIIVEPTKPVEEPVVAPEPSN